MPSETTDGRGRREDTAIVAFVIVALFAAALFLICWQTHQTVQRIVPGSAETHD